MIYLHKLLPLALSPIVVVLALLIAGLIVKKGKAYICSAVVVLYLLSMPIVSELLMRQIEVSQVKRDPAGLPKADAIVVLGGSLLWVESERGLVPEWSDADRFFAGLDLMLSERAPYLLFTGGKVPWDRGLEAEGHVLARYAERFGVSRSKIFVTDDVENTAQEAQAIKRLLSQIVGRSAEPGKLNIILVTSAFHMQRALALFEREDLLVIPFAVDFKVPATSLTPMSFLPSASALATTDVALRELLGIAYYKVRAAIFRW